MIHETMRLSVSIDEKLLDSFDKRIERKTTHRKIQGINKGFTDRHI